MGDIVWRGLNFKGHEYARLEERSNGVDLLGTAVFVADRQNCSLTYAVECDQVWNTTKAIVEGFVGSERIAIEVTRDQKGDWTLNGVAQPHLKECLDIDLNFSPSTNLLPIRRLNLKVGAESPVQAAWLRFPAFKLEVLSQTYRRTSTNTYRYESGGGSFVAELSVNDEGFVTNYPELWEQE